MAILQKDVKALRDVLRTVSITEDLLTVNGFSATSLAMDWPEGFRILTQTCLDLGLDIPEGPSLRHFLSQRRRLCRQDPHSLNSDCHCEELVEIILDLKIPIDKYDVPDVILDMAGISYALLEHIRYWRERLEALARQHLPISELQELGVSDGRVLDHAAPEVINRLEARGVSPSIEFGLERDDYRLSPPSNQVSGSSSIYHDIPDAWNAQIAFDLGFKDIDVLYEGVTPAMLTYDICYSRWLFSHGADMANVLPWIKYTATGSVRVFDNELPRHTVSHHIMGNLAYKLVDTMSCRLEWNTLDREALLPIPSAFHMIHMFCGSETGDGCECFCTDLEQGCTPIHIFTSWSYVLAKYRAEPKQVVECIQNLLSDTDNDTKARVSYAMVRLLTFQKLGLRHTCCTAYPVHDSTAIWRRETNYSRSLGYWKKLYEDFPNIREEDVLLRDELEDLMTEFNDEFRSGGYTLSTFIDTYWKKRMVEVEKEKEARRLTQAELDGIRALGVELHYGHDDEIEEVFVKIPAQRSLGDIVAEHIRKIDEIYMDK